MYCTRQELPGLILTKPLTNNSADPDGGPPDRLLAKTTIAGAEFWVDCIKIERGPDGDIYGNGDADEILAGAYVAFGIEGEVNTFDIDGHPYAVFLYPSTK
jgi:hypothetical protein